MYRGYTGAAPETKYKGGIGMAEKDNMKVNTSPVADVETGTAEDVEAIMKKYDRESNTPNLGRHPKQVIRFLLAAIFSFNALYEPVCKLG